MFSYNPRLNQLTEIALNRNLFIISLCLTLETFFFYLSCKYLGRAQISKKENEKESKIFQNPFRLFYLLAVILKQHFDFFKVEIMVRIVIFK